MMKDKIYIEQPFEVYHGSAFKKTHKTSVELLKEFIEGEPLKNLPNEEPLLVLVSGFPGHGKTSLLSKIINELKKGKIDATGNVYLIELRKVSQPPRTKGARLDFR